jgi:hypothetical protein
MFDFGATVGLKITSSLETIRSGSRVSPYASVIHPCIHLNHNLTPLLSYNGLIETISFELRILQH